MADVGTPPTVQEPATAVCGTPTIGLAGTRTTGKLQTTALISRVRVVGGFLALGMERTEKAMSYEPSELEAIEREEREARLRLAEARDGAAMNEGEVPTEHHELLRALEADWKHALERLHRIRGHAKD